MMSSMQDQLLNGDSRTDVEVVDGTRLSGPPIGAGLAGLVAAAPFADTRNVAPTRLTFF